MPLFHAVVCLDHHSAQVLQFDATQLLTQSLKAHNHPTRQHGSAVRAEHAFFDAVCDALDDVPEVLVTGSHTSLADFRHFVQKHRPALVARIAGYEVVDHPSDNQLVALARAFFLKHDRMAGLPVPT